MFFTKKLISQFLLPMPFCLMLCLAGLVLLWWTKRQKAGKILVTFGLLLLTALSFRPVSNALLGSLERQYPVYTKPSAEKVDFVVVLGAGHNSDPSIPLISQLSDDSLKRLIEGIRIYRENPGSKLVLSAGTWLDPVPNAKLLADSSRLLGVPESDIITETGSKDTKDQAVLLKSIVGTNRFVLVTSASHMPRAVQHFVAQEMQPEPAPVGHRVKQVPHNITLFFPSPGYLASAGTAIHEYLGLAWASLITSRYIAPHS